MAQFIDLNADMGEYADEKQAQVEAALITLVSSCSIACGSHAGDDETMRRTLRLAHENSVSAGAHPSYPDRDGFGRINLNIAPDSLAQSLRGQIARLVSIADQEGVALRHLKPHGALYNDAAKNIDLAGLVVSAATSALPGCAIMGPPGSALETAAHKAGAHFLSEGFVDRLYQPDGTLTPRTEPGAVIEKTDMRAAQASAIAMGESFLAAHGRISLCADTLCIHSDSAGAVETAKAVRAALRQVGIDVRSHVQKQ